MYTPRLPVRRRLVFTPATAKRVKVAATPARAYAGQNRFTTPGVRTKGTLAQQVRALQTVVNKLKPEVKYADIDLANTNIPDATGGVVHLSAVAQGDTNITRTGNAINIVNLALYFQITRQAFATAATINAGIRWAIVVDKEQVADTQPTVGAIFNNTAPLDPLPDLANVERFRVLYMSEYIDAMQMVLQASGSLNVAAQKSNVFKVVKKLNLKVGYNGTTVNDIEKNGLYFVIMLSGFTDQFDMTGTSRIGFTDV